MADDNAIEDAIGAGLTFGQLLKHYRETYHERFRKKYPGAPRVKFTALALIDCMREHGHSLTSGAYSEIENGLNLPRDPQRFIDAAARCLLLDDKDDYDRLARQLAYDFVRTRVGEKVAEIAFRRTMETDN